MNDESVVAALRSGERPWPCWIEVDLDAIGGNVEAVRGLVGRDCAVMAVVKAEAYGHGAVAVSRAALEAGAKWLAVARVREGVQLRRAGIGAPILVMGPAGPSEVEAAVEHDLRPTIVSEAQAREFSRAASAAGGEVAVHVKLGTGLNRYGVPPEEAARLAAAVGGLPGMRLEGVYSHFATADEADLSFARRQLAAFAEAVEALRAGGVRFEVVHMAASAATEALPESRFDAVRLGISLYGVYPAPHLRDRVSLRPALSMHSRLSRVFELRPGDSVGYGRSFVADRALVAGLVPVGYADGLPRSHSNRGAVLVKGRRAPIIGRVSMDQCVVDVSGCGTVSEGEPVVVVGAQGGVSLDIEDFAFLSGTISYEALTSLGHRVPRVYLRSGTPVAVGLLDEGRIVSVMSDG